MILSNIKNTFSSLLFIILGTIQLNAQPLNNYLQFDGVDDYVNLNNIDVTGSAITLEAIVNNSNLDNCPDNDCRIISKATSTDGVDHYWMLSTVNSGANTVIRFRLKTNGNTTTQYANIGALSNNTWYHVAGTYNGTTMKIFLDGIEVGSTPKTGSLTTNSAVDAWIGGNPPAANSRPWHGGIDEVRIWNTARTQAEIQTNKNTELTGNEAGLLAYYKFNETTGQIINDDAGNNNTVLGSTSNTDVNDPTFANTSQTITFNLQVFLEGPFDSGLGTMTGYLLQRSIVPQGQPYTGSPWNYPGTEGSGWLPIDYPVETVDWVLVSLRESLNPGSEVARVAAVLLKDGTISPFDVELNNPNTPLYVMVEHRNHLPIISAQAIPIVNNAIAYDFTTQNSYNPTGFGQKQIGNNWMMYGGNADQEAQNSCDINAGDRIFWQTVNGLFNVYNPGDFDLDGDINAADRIIYNRNNGIFTTIPKSSGVCPDNRYIKHTVRNITQQSVELEVEMSQNLPMRLYYFPTANPGSISYRPCEYSANYGAYGNEHVQAISGLTTNTEYTIIIQTSQDVGTSNADCATMNWEDISCPILVTTANQPQGGQFLTLPDFNVEVSPDDESSSGDWTGVHGSTPSSCSNSTWIRSEIQANGHFGSGRKYLFDPSVKEAWVTYSVQLGTNWTPSSNVKMPGFSSHVNGGWLGIAGGNGGGWAGLCRSWSARLGIVRPGYASAPGKLSQYLYHVDSQNFNNANTTIANHPCIDPSNVPVQASKRQFGQTYNGNPTSVASITDNDWHCITQHIKLNTINTANPNDPNAAYRDGFSEMYLDGVLISSATGLHFTNNPAYHNISFILQVYHGGSADNTGTNHDVFFDCINVSTGPVNGTQCY